VQLCVILASQRRRELGPYVVDSSVFEGRDFGQEKNNKDDVYEL
jgi:hypothetical protein